MFWLLALLAVAASRSGSRSSAAPMSAGYTGMPGTGTPSPTCASSAVAPVPASYPCPPGASPGHPIGGMQFPSPYPVWAGTTPTCGPNGRYQTMVCPAGTNRSGNLCLPTSVGGVACFGPPTAKPLGQKLVQKGKEVLGAVASGGIPAACGFAPFPFNVICNTVTGAASNNSSNNGSGGQSPGGFSDGPSIDSL